MPQNEHIELFRKRYGRKEDILDREAKAEARKNRTKWRKAKNLRKKKAMLWHKERYKEKVEIKKQIAMYQEKSVKQARPDTPGNQDALPAYLKERKEVVRAKILSNTLKQKRKEKAGKWEVPIPKVQAVPETEIFKVYKSGKRRKKAWKRLVSKVTFVPEHFTRKPAKYERFIRPFALRFKKAHVTHPDLKTTFCLDIIRVKKNPQSAVATNLGIITKGTIIEVNVSELGLVTPSGKIIWGKFAQVTNHPENDGCINAVLIV